MRSAERSGGTDAVFSRMLIFSAIAYFLFSILAIIYAFKTQSDVILFDSDLSPSIRGLTIFVVFCVLIPILFAFSWLMVLKIIHNQKRVLGSKANLDEKPQKEMINEMS